MAPATANKPGGLHFVVSTGTEKPDPQLRKLIRSHVMRGKNLGRILPPRERKKKDELTDGQGSFSISSNNSGSGSSLEEEAVVSIPRKFGSGVCVTFPQGVEQDCIETVIQFSKIAKQVLFALESCIFFERRGQLWIAPLVLDPAFYHCTVFTSQFFFDVLSSPNRLATSQRHIPHFVETVKLLRDRIASGDDEAKLSPFTVSAIMGLAGHALLTYDHGSAVHHLQGLHRIVNLRGGPSSFGFNPKLLLEVLRCDLGMALQSGADPVFFDGSCPIDAFIEFPSLRPFLIPDTQEDAWKRPDTSPEDADARLSQIWNVLSEFVSVIRHARKSGQLVSTMTFLELVASVMYRLVRLRFEVGSFDEAIRLGMLCFMCSSCIHWRSLGLSYTYLRAAFRETLSRPRTSEIPPRLLVWLLVIGAISAFEAIDDKWLEPLLLTNIEVSKVNSWGDMYGLLDSFLWIDFVHDRDGKLLYDSITRSHGARDFGQGS